MQIERLLLTINIGKKISNSAQKAKFTYSTRVLKQICRLIYFLAISFDYIERFKASCIVDKRMKTKVFHKNESALIFFQHFSTLSKSG